MALSVLKIIAMPGKKYTLQSKGNKLNFLSHLLIHRGNESSSSETSIITDIASLTSHGNISGTAESRQRTCSLGYKYSYPINDSAGFSKYLYNALIYESRLLSHDRNVVSLNCNNISIEPFRATEDSKQGSNA